MQNDTAQSEVEFLEYVDAENTLQGKAPRDEVHEKGLNHRSVHIAVFDAEGRLYIQKRAASKSILPGYWDISAAGHVEPGERYIDAARRELKEELGLETPLRFINVTRADERTGNEFAALFVTECRAEQVRPDEREIETGAWVELPGIAEAFVSSGDLAESANSEAEYNGPYSESLVQAVISLVESPGALPNKAQLGWDQSTEDAENRLREQKILPWPGVSVHAPGADLILTEADSGPMPRVEAWISRLLQVALMAAAALAVLAFPLRTPEALMEWAHGILVQNPDAFIAGFLFYQIYPILAAGDPLLLKETLVLQILLAVAPLAALLFLLRPARSLLKQPFFLVGALFALWSVVTIFIRLHDQALFAGAYTFSRIIGWGLLTILAASVIRTRRDAWKMLFWLAIPITLMAIGALEQHVSDTSSVFPKLAFNPRNRMSSSIGHNNGVAGILMFLWFPLLVGLVWPRGFKRRIVSGIGFGMVLFLILALQTRGVWIALLATTPPFLYFAKKAAGIELQLKHILIVTLFAILLAGAQSVRIWGNPFVGMVSFAERVKDLGPEKLRSTTQRRILKSATYYMSQKAERVVAGMGIGSFSYVYPVMQAEFYAHTAGEADVLLSPKRTVQAHSDILQIYIETGLIGILLFCAALFLLARHCERLWRHTPDSGGRLLLLAMSFPILATLIHALGDFPFHVASTSTIFFILFGILMAAPRFLTPTQWQIPEPNPLQTALANRRDSKFQASRFVLITLILFLFVPAIWFMLPNQAYMVGYTFVGTAQQRIQRYRTYPELQGTAHGREYLVDANRDLKSALRIFPPEPLLYKTRAHLYDHLAREDFGYLLRLQEQRADPELIEEIRTGVVDKLLHVLEDVNRARQNGLYYHEAADLAAGAYDLLSRADPANQQQHLNSRLIALKETFYLNPSYARGVVDLLRFYRQYLPEKSEEIAFYRQQLKRFNPDAYFKFYTNRYDIATYGQQYAEAVAILQLLQEDEPDNPAHFFNEAGVMAQWGNPEAARRLFEQARKKFPKYEYLLDYEMVPAIVEHDWKELYDVTTRLYNRGLEKSVVPGQVQAARLISAEKLGLPEAEELREEFDQVVIDGGDPANRLLNAMSELLYVYVGDVKEAARYADERIVLGKGIDKKMHPFSYVISADQALIDGDLRKVKNRMIEANAIDPNDLRTKRFMAKLAEDYPAMVEEINTTAQEMRDARVKEGYESFRQKLEAAQ